MSPRNSSLLLGSWLLLLALAFPMENEIFLHCWCLSWLYFPSFLPSFLFFSLSLVTFMNPEQISVSGHRLLLQDHNESWRSRLPVERTPLSADHPCKWVTRGARGMHKTLKRHFTSAHSQPLWFVGLFFSKLKTSLHTHWLLLITHIMVIYLLLINVSPYLFWRQGPTYLRLVWLCSWGWPLTPGCSDSRRGPSRRVYKVQGTEHRGLCVLAKHSSHWDISSLQDYNMGEEGTPGPFGRSDEHTLT